MTKPYHLTHTQRIENWLGTECLGHIIEGSLGMRYPVPIANVPGKLFAYDGEIYGTIQGGTGFASLDDLISERSAGGKGQDIFFTKAGTLAVNGSWASLWNVGPDPAAGGVPTAIPGGAVPTNTTVGGLRQTDPGGSDTTHTTTGYCMASTAPNTLFVYDRLWHAGSVLHNTTSAQTVSGTPTRYPSTASAGNFAFLETTTVLGATAHNCTMTYVDNAGNTAEAAAAMAVIVSSAVTRIPHSFRFIPLNSADQGLRNITQLQMSAASTGVSNIVIGKPLGWLPCPVANSMPLVMDGINSAFGLKEVLAGACVAFLERKGTGSATTYDGSILFVSG